jgi:hypothetical protein
VIMTQVNGDAAVRAAIPQFKALQAAYKGQGVEFFLLNSSLKDQREAIVAEAATLGADVPILIDAYQLVGEQLGVTRSAEVLVIDPKTWQVAYRGSLAGIKRNGVVTDLVAGKAVKAVSEAGSGASLSFPERDKKTAFQNISYAQTVAPIIQEKCAQCHQPGGIGPMALTTYEQIKGFAPMIRETIRTKRMPPFHADPSIGKWHDNKSLSAAQTKTLVHWIEAGAPRGTGADPLAAIKFQAPEWPLGKPDLVLDIPAYTIPANGIVEYQRPFAVNPLTEGKWLRASTIKVGQRAGVHHILTGYMAQVPAPGVQANESRWGASVGGYAVGAESRIMPTDLGTFIPAGGAIGFQNHYTPFGKEAVDKSQIALYFYPDGKKPSMVMRGATILDATISIPANVERHKEVSYLTFPKDALLYSAFPHAHYRGEASDLQILYPDGTKKLLLSLPKYDFNWQRQYIFEEPLKVPAGAKLIATYTYNNSKRNPANPDSNRVVPWGDQSFDEMLFTSISFRWLDETSDKLTNNDALLASTRTIGMLDDNVNGKVEMAELKGGMAAPLKAAFGVLDVNKDGALDASELQAAQGGGGRG